MFKGSYTALITPFMGKDASQVDYDAYEKIIEHQIVSGTDGLVPCGTTGESPTLTNKEHDAVIEFCVKTTNGRAKVMAGTGSNSTREAIERTQHAEKAGADAALVMTPYYNKPNQEGIYQHFKAIHDNSNIPIFIYNIPGRSVVNIEDETIARMAEMERIAGVKDATGDLNRPLSLTKLLEGKNKEFYQISGEDDSAVEFNMRGGVGCISVSSNIAPKTLSKVQKLCLENKFEEAEKLHKKVEKLHGLMFCETSPQPVKYAASLLGLCSGVLRLPLVEISGEHKNKIDEYIEQVKELEGF